MADVDVRTVRTRLSAEALERAPQFLPPMDLAGGAFRNAALGALAVHGWCLYRARIASVEAFEAVVLGLGLPMTARYGDLPSRGDRCGVFETTPYPPSEDILFHNEASHTPRAPRHIFFACLRIAREGGETPLSDGRLALSLLAPEIRRPLMEKGLTYIRNFIPGLDVSWQQFFGTEDRGEVERICAEQGIKARWRGDAGLETRHRTPAVAVHPVWGELLFHQIALHHPAFLDPDVRSFFEEMAGPDSTPRTVRFGTGEPIPDDWAHAIYRAHLDAGTVFPWAPGDILMLDNRRFAHGRMAFAGERENYVMLGELLPQSMLWS
ncbi:TauD/TfdA family dioxygenase [Methylobacterium sp. 1030]|uniref:TauD/TfdA family dioxygenase n=1 Tax=Methylobacterium sp. 1030 TaxID=3156404 RepID=UPI003399B3DB